MIKLRYIGIALAALLVAQPVVAQDAPSDIESRLEADMISMPNMVQALAKNLGQLHYLRTLCFGATDQTWRQYAQGMMDVEAKDDAERRRKLIKSFNEGYYDQKARFAQCSDAVSTDAAALAENGRHLASMLGDPYREQ